MDGGHFFHACSRIARTARALIGVSRPPFLLLPVCLTLAGSGAAAYEGAFDAGRTLLAGLGLVALHVAVNALNEASDARTGLDQRTEPTPFSGGSGTLPAGALPPGAAQAYGLVMAAVGLAIGAALVWEVGWPLAGIVAFGFLLILTYTPFLLRIGLGEPCAGLGLGLLPVLGVALVQGGEPGPAVGCVGAVATLMTLNLLLLNEFPDEEADRAAGRRHLVILLGRRGAARVHFLAAALATALIAAGALGGVLPNAAWIALLPLFFLAPVARWYRRGPDGPVPVRALAGNVAWNLGTLTLLSLALAVSAR
jgi:1,4-dihydroxy-2-naphthoate octaprenyltransferase